MQQGSHSGSTLYQCTHSLGSLNGLCVYVYVCECVWECLCACACVGGFMGLLVCDSLWITSSTRCPKHKMFLAVSVCVSVCLGAVWVMYSCVPFRTMIDRKKIRKISQWYRLFLINVIICHIHYYINTCKLKDAMLVLFMEHRWNWPITFFYSSSSGSFYWQHGEAGGIHFKYKWTCFDNTWYKTTLWKGLIWSNPCFPEPTEFDFETAWDDFNHDIPGTTPTQVTKLWHQNNMIN